MGWKSYILNVQDERACTGKEKNKLGLKLKIELEEGSRVKLFESLLTALQRLPCCARLLIRQPFVRPLSSLTLRLRNYFEFHRRGIYDFCRDFPMHPCPVV